MKKIIITSIALVCALCSCTKTEADFAGKTNSSEKQIITATVNVVTKLAYSENTPGGGGGLGSVCEAGDKFFAIQKTGDEEKIVTFNLKDGAGSASATFVAETEGVTATTEWTAVIGTRATTAGDEKKEIHCSFKGQDGKLSGVSSFIYVKAAGSGLTPSFDFDAGEKLSYVMRIKLPAGIKCIEYTPSAYWKVSSDLTKRQYYTPVNVRNNDTSNYAYAYAAFEPENTSTITLDAASANGDIVYIAVPAIDYSYKAGSNTISSRQWQNIENGVIVTLLNDDSDNATASCGAVLGTDISARGGKIGTYDMSSKTLLPRPKPSQTILSQTTKCDYNLSGRGAFSLKTDTYWAPFNLGADTESGKGNYYAWGEIEPKADYSESTASHRHSTDDSNYYLDIISIKQQVYPDSPSVYSIMGSRYDAARVQWGVAWRMPSFLEIVALEVADGISTSVVTIAGQNGVKLTLPGGYLFLPITNIMQGSSTGRYPGKTVDWATFWTADQLNRTDTASPPNYQPWMFGHQSGVDWWNNKSYVRFWWGLPIRPVLASSVISKAN